MRRGGLRLRVVALTTGLLAVAFALSSLLLLWVVLGSARTAADADLRRTADEVGTLVAQNRLPTTLPVSGARMVQVVQTSRAQSGSPEGEAAPTPRTGDTSTADDPAGASPGVEVPSVGIPGDVGPSHVAVGDEVQGEVGSGDVVPVGVVAASLTADRLTPLLSADELAVALRGEAVEVPANRVGESGMLRAVARTAGPQSRGLVVIAASAAPETRETLRPLVIGLAVALPLLLLAAAALSWRAVGATLAPVDALRAGAERIGGAGPDRDAGARLPVPEPDDEVRALAVTLNGMLERLDAAAATQRRFVADAAHELRSPVAGLRMQVEVAARIGDGGDLPAELLPDVERLSRLVDDLLLLARSGSARSAHTPERLDLAELVTAVLPRYADARVPIRLAHADPAEVSVDPLGMERVVGNLLDNAVRHARSHVEIRVRGPRDGLRARPNGAVTRALAGLEAVLEVADDGAGIAEADRERVFERFTRLDEARTQDAGGSGLGLPIVRELVHREGGEVTLHEGGPGLVVRVSLPSAQALADPSTTTADPPTAEGDTR